MADNSKIIVCDQEYDVGQKVVHYKMDPSISAYTLHCVSEPSRIYPTSPAKGLGNMAARYRERRLLGTDRSLPRLQQVLKQFVIHHDGMGTSRDCFRVLHDERGLSVHFLVDNDGTIFQTLDLVDCGFQAAGVNETSIGVELCSRGDKIQPGTYPEKLYAKYPREQLTSTINGHQWLSWGYTKEQYEAMMNLGKALARIFPGLPQAYPQDGGGEPLWVTLEDARSYAGYLGHYHVTNQKWDPGPWDFKKFISSIKGRMFFPATTSVFDKPEIPADSDDAKKDFDALYDNNEKEGEGGYYPVGPIGATWLWHSGLHLRADRGTPVYAPYSGKIVAARMKAESDWPRIGSSNFVLIKSEENIDGQKIEFFTLLFHLDEESDDSKAPSWMKNGVEEKWYSSLKNGDLTVVDKPVAAGDVVGHFGIAGPGTARAGQIHFEIFAVGDDGDFSKLDSSQWNKIDGGRYRFVADRSIVGNFDLNNNHFLEATELRYVFKSPLPRFQAVRGALRKLEVHHLSEWGDTGDFEAQLAYEPSFHAYPPATRHMVFEDQIKSMFWWTDEVAAAGGLPSDKMVYSYHPIAFVQWTYEKTKGAVSVAKAIQGASAYKGEKPPDNIKDDASDGAEGMIDDEDALFGEAAKNLTLEQLANGYPD